MDEQIGDAALATQPTLATATRKGTLTSEGTTSKAAVAGDLTESQAKMPPPAATVAAVRNSARRSASNSPAPSSPLLGSSVQELQKLARNGVSQLAPTYDLPGLLAGAIVFHRTATISASEAVRSVLTTTPGLMKGQAGEHSVAFSPSKRKLPGAATLQQGCTVDGWPTQSEGGERWTSIARKAWREHLEVVLQSSPMFGVIQRAGKDASGNPLECWYYYDKENDPDKERAENLGVFAKPMRKALKGQKTHLLEAQRLCFAPGRGGRGEARGKLELVFAGGRAGVDRHCERAAAVVVHGKRPQEEGGRNEPDAGRDADSRRRCRRRRGEAARKAACQNRQERPVGRDAT